MIAHLRGRDRKLEPLGWTGQDAEWIALVCLHSGVFNVSFQRSTLIWIFRSTSDEKTKLG